ncbi:MAG: translation initiation factor IF-2 subunit alpha [Methanomicrobiales archaeon]|jgi:translation initiation factor 2 subunit 1|nr:translation initiation factor IF-2 subunit alpha [Methanomicrobiales archaeon]
MQEREWPEQGELVVCSVQNVKDFVAFVTLDEYNNREGLIPIAEVARGWIKYIRDHIREGQKVVCKVLNVDPQKGHIDLSLKDVNEHQRREKIRVWKNESKARKWIGFAAEAAGQAEGAHDIASALYREYGELYAAFEDFVTEGRNALNKLKIDPKLADALYTIATENVKLPSVTISGDLFLRSTKSDGVNIIRRALRSAEPKVDGAEIEITYLGAPNYRIKVIATNYKDAEKALEKSSSAAIGVLKRAGGEGKFSRKSKSGKHV